MNTKVSNCITEIPQDIKLELNNGTLTLKAGSKVYVPNGFESDGVTSKFDVKIIDSDLSVSSTGSNGLLFCNKDNNALLIENYTRIFSGSTNPNASSSSYYIWYDTSSNLIKRFTNTSTNPAYYTSLPLAYIERDSESIKNISQVFNGFGYIGSTIFALPGVKGLIPNGRNADGSLKNIEFTLDKVLTETFPNLDVPLYVTLKTNSLDYWQVAVTPIAYSETENFFINGHNIKSSELILGISYLSSGKITSFTPKTTFHALDYNDKSTISGWSMPSSRYIDLTLGASGSRYAAPANGYFSWYCYQNNNGYIFVQTSASLLPNRVAKASNDIAGFIPVKKGDMVLVEYANLTFNRLRFIFAE